jgi:hypothetical protein
MLESELSESDAFSLEVIEFHRREKRWQVLLT